MKIKSVTKLEVGIETTTVFRSESFQADQLA